MNHVLPPALLTSAIIICIGIGVWRKAPKASSHLSFAIFATSVAGWNIAIGLVHTFPGTAIGTLSGRLTFFFASLIPLAFHRFIDVFPSLQPPKCKWLAAIRFSAAISFALLSLTPAILVDTLDVAGSLKVVYGPVHPAFAVFFIVSFLLVLISLWVKSRSLVGTPRIQARYLLLGVMTAFVGASITNIVLPVLFGMSRYGQYGTVFAAVMFAVIGHTILRHRLMDIRVVLKRGAILLCTTVGAVVLLLAALATSKQFMLHKYLSFFEVTIALVVALLFIPIRRLIARAFDNYLNRHPYDYALALKDASEKLAASVELETLSEVVGSAIDCTLHPEAINLYLRSDDSDLLVTSWSAGMRSFPGTISISSPPILELETRRRTFFRDDASDARTDVVGHSGSASATAPGMESIEVLLPLLDDQGLVGLIALGEKKSGEPYYSDDADLLTTLANHAAVAIRNALAHQRVVLLNEELMKIIGSIESGVIAVGANRKISLFNQAAAELTGAECAATLGGSVDQVPAPINGYLEAALQDGTARSQEELVLPDAAGQLRPLVCSTVPLLSPRGGVVGAVAVLGDLSRLKELEQERRRLERLGSIESIASGLVHEIRNPLLAVKTFSHLMPARHEDRDFRDTFARVTAREIGRIEELLSRFRTLATTSTQPMGPVDIRQPIRDALETLRPQIEERHVTLRQVADGVPRPITGNASQLEQLFLNLCLNAIQAMESGGELTVRVADLSEGGGTTLLVEVSDTGCGIPDELLGAIFNPFVTTKPGGTGLGLAICRGIADAHQARLSARNNVERPGSTFTLEFPVPAGDRARTRS